jgi:hypothetical protein
MSSARVIRGRSLTCRRVRRGRGLAPTSKSKRPNAPRGSLSLHPNARLVAQSNRNLVQHPLGQGASRSQLPLREATHRADRRLHLRLQRGRRSL